MIRATLSTIALLAFSATASMAAEIVIKDGATQPENLTVTPDGDVIVGSFATPMINIVRKGATTAETFIDLTNDGGGTTFGVLSDAANSTLWACQAINSAGSRASVLRGFDLKTGAAKLRWTLPAPASCNDFTVAPDKSVYVADTRGKIYKLAVGSQVGELFLEGQVASGVDGIAFLNGTLYFNNIFSSKLCRVPIDAAGKAGTPVEITVDTPLNRPDGMRAGGGKLFVTEQGSNRISSLTITGDTAKSTVVKDGLQRPTGVQPDGDTLWYNELTSGKVSSMPIPK